MNEAELARFYGVSRTVARDVVGRLQQRGIVEKDERSRWFAPALTPSRVDDLYELRAILEPTALKKAAERAPAALIEEIRANLADAAARAHEIGGDVLDRLEEDLHIRLLQHCGNTALMDAITVPQSLLIAHRFLYRWTPRLFATEPFLPEHKAILDHLANGRVDAAGRAMEEHLFVSRERAIARVDVIVRDFAPDPLPYLDALAPPS
ncbi:GntR family transcriptional regulator [Acuticoccus sp. M5D2P5]|nr:GntR family transcriptional regulator [Acuticoccus kalidii]